MTSILILPNELIEKCIRYCSLKDILNVFLTCTSLNEFRYLLNEADRLWDIDELDESQHLNQFLIPIVKKLTNVRSWHQLYNYSKLISVTFDMGITVDPSNRISHKLSHIKQIIIIQSVNEKIIYDYVFTDIDTLHDKEIWDKQCINNLMMPSEFVTYNICQCSICINRSHGQQGPQGQAGSAGPFPIYRGGGGLMSLVSFCDQDKYLTASPVSSKLNQKLFQNSKQIRNFNKNFFSNKHQKMPKPKVKVHNMRY
jgi:hypothetical protein